MCSPKAYGRGSRKTTGPNRRLRTWRRFDSDHPQSEKIRNGYRGNYWISPCLIAKWISSTLFSMPSVSIMRYL